MTNNLKIFCVLLSAAWLTTGCVHNVLPKPEITIQSPKPELSGLKKFYVSRNDENYGAHDEKRLRGLHAVQAALTDHGMPATSGPLADMPSDTECKVIIHEHWFYDLEWYLLSLDLKFYDVKSGALLASGHDTRARPTIRRSPEFVANELIEAMFSASGGTSKP